MSFWWYIARVNNELITVNMILPKGTGMGLIKIP